mmetsp:Transcript_26110/g.43140  ORF Transcript_26110/g.43140 Transcript_26110/m.43140 type:complete len:201 (+) Transcript_26110:47-649(+)
MRGHLLSLLSLTLSSPAAAQSSVRCDTTAGPFTIKLIDRKLAPIGISRFIELVKRGFFTDQILYRVIPGFLVQFGVAADPNVQAKWQDAKLADETNSMPFKHGTVSFAGNGKNSRSCHLFVALEPNGARLGNALHEATIGHVTEGMETWEAVAANFKASGYPDTGSLQNALVQQGNIAALKYPKLDRITSCALEQEDREL